MLKPDFAFCHSAMHEKYVSQGLNAAVYGEAKAIPCRIELKMRREPAADTALCAGRGFFPADCGLACGDRLNFDGQVLQVISVEKICDFSGKISHLEAEFK